MNQQRITVVLFPSLVWSASDLRVFQRVNDLPPTGEVDKDTLEVMRQPRCGVEDPFNKKFLKYRVMGEPHNLDIRGYTTYL